MKKKDIIDLIKYHSLNNDVSFNNIAYKIADEFDSKGDHELAQYIYSLTSKSNNFIPQQLFESDSEFLDKVNISNVTLPLPEVIEQDILGLLHVIQKNVGISKYLFTGVPGTGKTETVKHLARICNRELYSVNFNYIIDSKLGQTQKNISKLFSSINSLMDPNKVIILFDELDALALDRSNSQDSREMGRVTSSLLKELDKVNPSIVIIATTNLMNLLDPALKRRFDSVIDFDRYTKDDLTDIAKIILIEYLTMFDSCKKNLKIFEKILSLVKSLPMPGILKNLIKTSVAFSSPQDPYDYLKRFYYALFNEKPSITVLKEQGFTTREIEVLSDISRSKVSRLLKENA